MNKKIIFDARHISNEFSGLGRYSLHLLEGLVSHATKMTDLVIFVESTINEENSLYKRLCLLVGNCSIAKVEKISIKVFSFNHYFKLHKVINQYDDYEYFYPHFDLPFAINNSSQFVIHDLFPLVVKGYMVKRAFLKKIAFYLLCMRSLLSKSSDCVAISNSTFKDILKYFPFVNKKNIRVVHSSDCLVDMPSKNVSGMQPYLFFIGDRRPHKNLKKMIDIFLLLQQNFGYEGSFIIAGSKANFDIDLDNYVADKKNINIIGPVSDEELSFYYQNMNALFFLSKYEGFGLPILEAARFNKKIITSNTSSLPEVTPCSGLMLSPDGNNEELARSIASYLSSTLEIKNETFLTNFSWPKTAREIFFDTRNI